MRVNRPDHKVNQRLWQRSHDDTCHGEIDHHIDAYSPADGRVTSIQHFGAPVGEDKSGLVDDFRIEIQHTCAVSSTYIHITELNDELMAHERLTGNPNHLVGARSNPRNPKGFQLKKVLTGQRPGTSLSRAQRTH